MHRSSARLGVTGLILLMALTSAGCTSGVVGEGAGTPPPRSAPVVPGTPSSAAPTTPAPAPAPTPTPTTATWRLSNAGIGPLALGRTWGDMAGDPTLQFEGDLTTCSTVFLVAPDYQFAITFGDEVPAGPKAAVTSVAVAAFQGRGSSTPPVLGQEGVTIGSPLAAVQAAYPGGAP